MLDLLGKRFGKLFVLAVTAQRKKGSVIWRCRCDCGNTHFVAAKHLVHNHTASCGCSNGTHLPEGQADLNRKLVMYKRNAAKRTIPFLLTKEEFEGMIKKDCTYCGTPAEPFNGIDRVRNWDSYRIENVVPCCYICNRAKSTLPHDDFLNHIKKVFNHSLKN